MAVCNAVALNSEASGKHLDPELAARALKQVNENPETRAQTIQALRQRILGEKNLTAPTDDAFLVRFLRSCNYNLAWAFRTMQKYYTTISKHPEIYKRLRPSIMLKTLNENILIVLPDRDAFGRRVVVIAVDHWNPNVCTAEDIFICFQMCMESIIDEDETQINGVVIVVDMKNFTRSQAVHVKPNIVKKYLSLFEEYFPAQFKEFHIINESYLFSGIYLIVKPFLSKEATSRLHFHGKNRQSLNEHVSLEILPGEFGSENPPMDNSSFVTSLLARDDEIYNAVAEYGYR